MCVPNNPYKCYKCHLKKIKMCESYHVLDNKNLYYRVYNFLKNDYKYIYENDIHQVVYTILSNLELVLILVYEQIYVKKSDLRHDLYKKNYGIRVLMFLNKTHI